MGHVNQTIEKHYIEAIEGLGRNVPLQMQLIPAGKFEMGFSKDEREYDFGKSQRVVTVRSFFMGRYPVTQAQWQAVAAWQPVNRELEPTPSYFKGNNLPVEQVSWYEAVEFCDRLSTHTDRLYRLPNEAEWEYACRAGTTTPFHFGQTLTTEVANFKGAHNGIPDYQDWTEGDYRQTTTPVDYFDKANAFGLFDMHGNVWEWCQDKEISKRVLRGGSWCAYPKICRSAYRLSCLPEERDFRNGFRVSCSIHR